MLRRALAPLAAAVLAVSLGFAPAAGAASSEPKGVPTTGVYVADTGFRPAQDGFGFENYVNDGATNLTKQSMRRLFGDDVCLDADANRCSLTPAATTWLQFVNHAMNGGHCEGLAVTAQRFYLGLDDPEDYGAAKVVDLERGEALEETIAYWWSTQATQPAGQGRRQDLTPTRVVELLRAAFTGPRTADSSYTLEFFTREGTGGHAITPYAVEDRGDGVFWIMVYDNNFPREQRAVVVDTTTDTWSYASGVNPQAEKTEYEGDGETKNLQVTQLSARGGVQACPFCAGELDAQTNLVNQVVLTGRASRDARLDFYVTDTVGRRTGRVDGAMVQEIPGAAVSQLTGASHGRGRNLARDSAAPVLVVPATLDARITVAAPETLEEPAEVSTAMIGAGFDVAAEDLVVRPGHAATIGLRADGSAVTYEGTAHTTPSITVGTGPDQEPASPDQTRLVPDGSDATYLVTVRGHAMQRPARTAITSDEDDNLLVQTGARGRFDVDLVLDHGKRAQRVALDDLLLGSGDTLRVSILEWDGDRRLGATVVDAEGDERHVVFERP